MREKIEQALIYLTFTIIGVGLFVFALNEAFGICPHIFEIIGITFNILGVSLIRKQNVIGWWASVVSAACIGAFAVINDIYAQAYLQLAFFLPSCVYAIYAWNKAKCDRERPRWMTCKEWLFAVGLFVLAAGASFFIIDNPDTMLHTFDVSSMAFVLTAQILMVLKKKECWLVFIPGNLVAITLFYMVEGYLLAGLNVFFCINAMIAFIQWSRE